MPNTFCLSCGTRNEYQVHKPESCKKCLASFNNHAPTAKTSTSEYKKDLTPKYSQSKNPFLESLSEIEDVFLNGGNKGVSIRDLLKNNAKT